MDRQITAFRDALGAAESYLHAMSMMFEAVDLDHDVDACAFDLILSSARDELAKAQGLVDKMEVK
jgi:hypothetical protein